jgi:hypothetical protein
MANQKLQEYVVPSFKDGFNSYAGSKTLIKKTEVPAGLNTQCDDNGSMTKRLGSVPFGGEIVAGHVPTGFAQYKTGTVSELIVACNTGWYKKNGNSWTLLTGKTFTADKDTHFIQAQDRLYGCNGTDVLTYYDGTDLHEVTALGSCDGIFTKIEYAYQRLWGASATDKGTVWFSNPYAADGTLGDFGTFTVDLGATPVKNAGFIQPMKGSGTEIVDLREDGGQVWQLDKKRVRKIGSPTENTDKSVSFEISVVSSDLGGVSPRGTVKTLNDFWLYSGENLYTNGEVAQFQSPRTTPKSGRIRSEMASVTNAGKSKVALGYFEEKIYFAYQMGSYNDHVIVLDTRLNAWGTPFTGWNVGAFLDYDDAGNHRFLAMSSYDSYIYELETGNDDNGTAISAFFDTISTDCGMPGRVKRFAHIDVFYGMLYGALTYEVFIDEVSSITGQVQIGASTTAPSGIGTQIAGTFMIGQEYDPNTEFADLKQNSSFRIECDYTAGYRISVRFTNNNSGEQFKINGFSVYHLPGDVYEQL